MCGSGGPLVIGKKWDEAEPSFRGRKKARYRVAKTGNGATLDRWMQAERRPSQRERRVIHSLAHLNITHGKSSPRLAAFPVPGSTPPRPGVPLLCMHSTGVHIFTGAASRNAQEMSSQRKAAFNATRMSRKQTNVIGSVYDKLGTLQRPAGRFEIIFIVFPHPVFIIAKG